MQRLTGLVKLNYFALVILLMANILTGVANASEDQCSITLPSSLVLKDSSFTPVNMSFTPVLRLGREYLGTLLRYDADANLVPSLAKSWAIAPDNRSITFQLDRTCHWSDGAPITANQFKAGFETLFDPSTSFTANGGFAPLSELIKGANAVRNKQVSPKMIGLRALDEATFVVETEGPADLFLQALTSHNYTPLPTHWINAGKMKWSAPEIWQVASGPYVVQKVDPKMVVMGRNPHFCKGQEKPLKAVRYLLDSPRQATIGMFLNGAIDGVDRFSQRIVAPLLKNVDQIRKFKFTAPGGSPDRVYTYLFVN
ncbi:putative extracellular solute-binding protein [Roseibium sp. TrichSKD4]|nr:ABC transporter substrate-binding protein [Roseibium sp. TrichSKD4]EFO34187.1 putative extracellular solute-binding protein [Roseibium sp. TrichSKD4]